MLLVYMVRGGGLKPARFICVAHMLRVFDSWLLKTLNIALVSLHLSLPLISGSPHTPHIGFRDLALLTIRSIFILPSDPN